MSASMQHTESEQGQGLNSIILHFMAVHWMGNSHAAKQHQFQLAKRPRVMKP
jgi:hypothetical protein